jgi:hypothetical protein
MLFRLLADNIVLSCFLKLLKLGQSGGNTTNLDCIEAHSRAMAAGAVEVTPTKQ